MDKQTEDSLRLSLVRMGLLGPAEPADFTPLTGGVSSLIVKVATPRGALCLKRALPKLKVAKDWFAPVERNAAETAWTRLAGTILPGAVATILGEDPQSHTFAMEYLDGAAFPVWKELLLDGRIEPATAGSVARTIAAIHNATAGDQAVAQRFANDGQFAALRLEPYLEATARVHPELAEQLEALYRCTAATKRALVHGDVSPKNILAGTERVILLDAECAWYGDPAFDLAFCLNHMILKSAHLPQRRAAFGACFEALAQTYLGLAGWEDKAGLERRVASLLPGLLLARIDGKSPVEYLVDEKARERVRSCARAALVAPPPNLAALWRCWEEG
jgi:aminoglycoside phosphotransferase (APT) family kinase protein